VPGAGKPLAWNRYAYTLYNPLIYTDPSGHWTSKRQYIEIMLESSLQQNTVIDLSYLNTLEEASNFVNDVYAPPAPYRYVTPTPLPTLNQYDPNHQVPEINSSTVYTYLGQGSNENIQINGWMPDDDSLGYPVYQGYQVTGEYSVIFSENGTSIRIDMEFTETGVSGNPLGDDSFVAVQEVVVTLSSGETVSGGAWMYIEGNDRPVNIDVYLRGAFYTSWFPRLLNREHKYILE